MNLKSTGLVWSIDKKIYFKTYDELMDYAEANRIFSGSVYYRDDFYEDI